MVTRLLERLFVVLLLLSSLNVITALTQPSSGQEQVKLVSGAVNMSSVAIELGVYIFGLVLALTRWRQVLRATRLVWPLLALAVLAVISTMWSIEPIVTLRRGAALLAATMLAIYVGERYSIKVFARLLAYTLSFVALVVVVLYLVAPEYVVDFTAYGGAWKGLSMFKNTFGEHMAVAVVVLALVRFPRWAWLRYALLLTAAGLLLLSRSATALICCVLALAAIPLWRRIRGEQGLLIYPLVAVALLAGMYLIVVNPELLFWILGRDITLTGRTHLWTILLPVIAKHPILGYGYSAFWTGFNAETVDVWVKAHRFVPIADNGYFDLGLDLGALGICVFLYVFVRCGRAAIAFLRWEPGQIGLWPVSYLCLFAVNNICESSLLARGTFPFLVFAVLTTSLEMHRRRAVGSGRTAAGQQHTTIVSSDELTLGTVRSFSGSPPSAADSVT